MYLQYVMLDVALSEKWYYNLLLFNEFFMPLLTNATEIKRKNSSKNDTGNSNNENCKYNNKFSSFQNAHFVKWFFPWYI